MRSTDGWHYRAWDETYDAVGTEVDGQFLVFVTGLLSGAREVVAVMAVPIPRDRSAIDSRLEALLAALDPRDFKAPLSQMVVRTGLMRQAMLHRRTFVRREGATEEASQMDYLPDAIAYVEALRMGAPPAEVIAERRAIVPRSAEARIRRARELGLLTPAEGRKRGGQLTPLAERMRRERAEEVRAAERLA
jgi:hypothetical protein